MLKEYINTFKFIKIMEVLILILMEHAQRESLVNLKYNFKLSLNPYFNGTCSKRMHLFL